MKKISFIKPKLSTSSFCLLGIVILCYLGQWQMHRLDEKTDLLAKIAIQTNKAPEPLPKEITDTSAWDYRAVSVAGKFLHDKAIFLQPRIFKERLGGHLITPLRRISGEIVLINRGWVSKKGLENITKPRGIIKISAYAKNPPQKKYFTPENSPQKNEWYWLEKPTIDKQLNTETFPLVLYQMKNNDNTQPIGGQLRLSFPNDHFGYAVFWFGMGLAIIFMYALTHIKIERKKC